MGKIICITGGAGFIGTNLIRKLEDLEKAEEIRALDNMSLGDPEHLKGTSANLTEGDVRDKGTVDEFVKGADTVIHLAAHTRVVDSIGNPKLNFDINCNGTLNVLEASRKHGVRNFIFASTGGAIIGDATPPLHEDMVPRPVSPYGATKLFGEGMCSAYWGSYGLKTVSLRFTNVYGPYSKNKASAVAQFFKNVIDKEPITLYGDGSQTRDFVYVGDVCNAIIRAIDYEGDGGESFQIGSAEETSLSGLIDRIGFVVGDEMVEVNHKNKRKGEIQRNYAKIDKARKHLGYKPETNLNEGIRKTWEWFKENYQHC